MEGSRSVRSARRTGGGPRRPAPRRAPVRRPRPGAPGLAARAARAGGRLALRLALLLALVLVALQVTGALDELEQRYRPSSPRTTPYADLFRSAAQRYPQVSAAQLAAQARAESGFDADAVSPAGAEGLMQIVPGTFADFGRDADGDGRADPFDPADSVHTAAAYLTWLGERLDLPVGDERVIAAYNAGPGAVADAGGVPDFEETRTYVERVTGWVPGYRWLDEPAGGTDPAASGPASSR